MLGALLVYKYHCCFEHWIGTREIRRKIKQTIGRVGARSYLNFEKKKKEPQNELKTETDHTRMHKTLIPPHDPLAGRVLAECRGNLFIAESVSAD